jgi:hypothetical protein
MTISVADHVWVKENYPGLQFENGGGCLLGDFVFNAAWDETKQRYLINPSSQNKVELICIYDSYQIRIELSGNGFPILSETGGRILANATVQGLAPRDLHIYENGETCPTGEFSKTQIKNVQEYLDGPVLQYFYDQSYHERYGRWPRGEFLHGLLGLIEDYNINARNNEAATLFCLDKILKQRKNDDSTQKIADILGAKQRIQGHWPCLCGSGRNLKLCHPDLYYGLWALQDQLKKMK